MTTQEFFKMHYGFLRKMVHAGKTGYIAAYANPYTPKAGRERKIMQACAYALS